MTLVEFIGFILTMFLLVVLSARNTAERKRRAADPNFYGLEEEEEIEEEHKQERIAPPRTPKAVQRQKKRPIEQSFASAIGQRQRLQLEAEPDPYSLIKERNKTPLEKIFGKLDSKKEMMILHEVLKKPKALRDDEYDS